jgi:hypothetical protein
LVGVSTFDQVLEPWTIAMVSPGTFHLSICCCTKASSSGVNGELVLLMTILKIAKIGEGIEEELMRGSSDNPCLFPFGFL